MSCESSNQITDLSESDREQSVCVNVEETDSDAGDEKKNVVVIRIEAGVAAETDEINTDSLNSNNSCEKQDQSLTVSENSTQTVSSESDGLSNPGFVEDEVTGAKPKKGHRRQQSCSPNKDIEVSPVEN